ncbi:hypothetical protein [Polynucleobacter sp. AP-RePozz3-80-G7]|nr:hypothetical protein [Polynucleobacter sp. AP-RePozz3-80-G7]
MSGKRHQSEDASLEKKPEVSEESHSFLKKRLKRLLKLDSK